MNKQLKLQIKEAEDLLMKVHGIFSDVFDSQSETVNNVPENFSTERFDHELSWLNHLEEIVGQTIIDCESMRNGDDFKSSVIYTDD